MVKKRCAVSEPRELWVNCPQDNTGKWYHDEPEDVNRREFVTQELFYVKFIEKSAADKLAEALTQANELMEKLINGDKFHQEYLLKTQAMADKALEKLK